MAFRDRSRFRPVRRVALGLWVLAAGTLAAATFAQPSATERELKAVYLYRFAGFIEWPEGAFARPDSPLLIGVAGNDELAAQAERMVAARSQSLLTVTDSDAAAGLGGMIRFVVARQRLRFEVALAEVQPSRLRISARMLAAAASVSGAP